MCHQEPETCDHLFFGCAFAVSIWKEMLRNCGLERESLGWDGELRWASTKIRGKAMITTLLRVGWSAFIYHIWKERNCRLFQHKEETTLKILEDIMKVTWYRLAKLKKVEADEINIKLQKSWGLLDSIFY